MTSTSPGLIARLLAAGVLCTAVTTPALAQQYNLNVVHGAGSGMYAAGSRVFISANPYDTDDPDRATNEPVDEAAAGGSHFVAWAGSVDAVEDPRSPETWITMPASHVVVVANYGPAERWAPSVVWQEIPEAPAGVVFMFHGGQGSTATMAVKAESGVFAQQAVARGYGVVFLESFERKDGEFNWDKTPYPAENYDMRRVAAVRTHLIDEDRMTEDTPVYLWGVSGGGQFASLFVDTVQQALDFPVAAQVLIVSAGEGAQMRQTTTPTLFLLGDNDRGVRRPALNSYEDLQLRGIPTELYINVETPVHPERFWRIKGLDRDDSLAIHAALKAGGILDGDDYLIDRPKDLGWEASIPPQYLSFIRDIEDQLYIAYGGHRLMANLNHRIFEFFRSVADQ